MNSKMTTYIRIKSTLEVRLNRESRLLIDKGATAAFTHTKKYNE